MSAFSSPRQARRRASITNALALLAACLLGGCVTSGVEQAAAPSPEVAVAPKRSARECAREALGKPDYQPLHAKIPAGAELSSGAPALTNRDHPTAAEKALLDALNAELHECRQIALTEAPPSRVAKLTELHAATEKLWTEAAAGRLTWGRFNQRRSMIGRQAQALLAVPAPVATASRPRDMFALDNRYNGPSSFGSSLQPGPRPTISIRSPAVSNRAYCDTMRHTAYCESSRR